MPYTDLNTIHNPSTGTVAPATWGDQIRTNQEFFVDPPSCNVNHNTTQSVSASTETILSANSERWDNDAMHSTVTNNSRITINTAGRYTFRAAVQFAGDGVGGGSGQRRITFLVNGTTASLRLQNGPGSGGDWYGLAFVDLALVATDYVEVRVWQSHSSALNAQLHEFAATWITR